MTLLRNDFFLSYKLFVWQNRLDISIWENQFSVVFSRFLKMATWETKYFLNKIISINPEEECSAKITLAFNNMIFHWEYKKVILNFCVFATWINEIYIKKLWGSDKLALFMQKCAVDWFKRANQTICSKSFKGKLHRSALFGQATE